MTHAPEYVPGITTHARRGGIANAFRYRVDYVLIDPEARNLQPRHRGGIRPRPGPGAGRRNTVEPVLP